MGASIFKRGPSYRLRLRYKDYHDFSLTFKSYEEAQRWAEQHESEYIKDPDKYHQWVKKNRESIKKKGIFHRMYKLENIL